MAVALVVDRPGETKADIAHHHRRLASCVSARLLLSGSNAKRLVQSVCFELKIAGFTASDFKVAGFGVFGCRVVAIFYDVRIGPE